MDANVPVGRLGGAGRGWRKKCPDKGESLGKYEFPRLSTTRTEVLIDALTEVSAYAYF
jgi:hypothetical protein